MSEHEQEPDPFGQVEVGGDAVVISADQVNVTQPEDEDEDEEAGE